MKLITVNMAVSQRPCRCSYNNSDQEWVSTVYGPRSGLLQFACLYLYNPLASVRTGFLFSCRTVPRSRRRYDVRMIITALQKTIDDTTLCART